MMKLSKLITTLSLLLIGVILAGTPAKATAGPPYVADDPWSHYWVGRVEQCVSMDHMGLTQEYEDCIAGIAHDVITMGQISFCTIGLAAAFTGIWGSSSYLLLQRLLATLGIVGGLACGSYYSDWFGF